MDYHIHRKEEGFFFGIKNGVFNEDSSVSCHMTVLIIPRV